MGSFFQSHYLYHLVGRDIREILYLGKETRAADAHLVGKEVDVEVGIGEILLDNLLHPFEEVLVDVRRCNFGDRLRRIRGVFLAQHPAHVHDVHAACFEIAHRERFLYVCVSTHVHSFHLGIHVSLCREHDERDMTRGGIAAHPPAELRPVHTRHHPVADDERHVVSRQLVQCLKSVVCRYHAVFLRDVLFEIGEHVVIVVYH